MKNTKHNPKNVTTFTMRINLGVKKALEEAAWQDRRSLASLFEKIGIDYLKVHGIPWTEEYLSTIQTQAENR
jgi:hypothetical protein